MAKIIEYLASDKTFFFTANTGVTSVTGNTGIITLHNANGKGIFVEGDSLILLSYGIMLPENFTFFQGLGYGLPALNIYGQDTAALPSAFPLPCFQATDPATTLQRVTEENREHEINGFCNYKAFKSLAGKIIIDNYFLIIGFLAGVEISMINVPAVINGQPFYIVPFVKVAHNLPLI